MFLESYFMVAYNVMYDVWDIFLWDNNEVGDDDNNIEIAPASFLVSWPEGQGGPKQPP